MKTRTALIFGATGFVGGYCLDALLADPTYHKVTALVRRPLRQANHPKLDMRVVDFDDPTLADHVQHHDHVFCALGTTIGEAGSRKKFYAVDYTLTLKLCQLARDKGAEHLLLVTSSGVEEAAILYYCRVKAALERAVRDQNWENLTILRPALFRGKREKPRVSETIGKALMVPLGFLYVGILKKYKPIHARVVGEAMVVAARTQEAGAHILESHQLTQMVEAAEASAAMTPAGVNT